METKEQVPADDDGSWSPSPADDATDDTAAPKDQEDQMEELQGHLEWMADLAAQSLVTQVQAYVNAHAAAAGAGGRPSSWQSLLQQSLQTALESKDPPSPLSGSGKEKGVQNQLEKKEDHEAPTTDDDLVIGSHL